MEGNQSHGGVGLEQSFRKKKFVKEERKLIQGGGGLKKSLKNKRLYICTDQSWPGYKLAYVIRVIDLGNLLMSPSSVVPMAWQVACLPRSDLPVCGGCGVLGSKIVFAGGDILNEFPLPPCRSVYAFDIHDPKKEIVEMPQTLNAGKEYPVMVEFSCKLYILSCSSSGYNFEVFDPDRDTWSTLPYYPDPIGGTPQAAYSYALAGSKLFVSTPKMSNIIFADLTLQPRTLRNKSGRASTLCKGKPFPFFGMGLVLDLEQHPNQKLLFALKAAGSENQLAVYILSLDEDQEDITEIFQTKLPAEFPNVLEGYHFFHLGGNNVCLVNCSANYIDDDNDCFETVGAAMLFEYDICKKNEQESYSVTVKFQPPRPFGYNGVPRITPTPPHMFGCFVL